MSTDAATTSGNSGCHASWVLDQTIVSHDIAGSGKSCGPTLTAVGSHNGITDDTTSDTTRRNGRCENFPVQQQFQQEVQNGLIGMCEKVGVPVC